MVNRDVIEKEILSLEGRDTTYAVCERLAMLYTVRDHLTPNIGSVTSSTVDITETDSDFKKAISGVSMSDLADILDEHMDVIRILYPKEYNSVIDRIKRLH